MWNVYILHKCCLPAVNMYKTGMLLFLLVTSLGIIITEINHKAKSFEQFSLVVKPADNCFDRDEKVIKNKIEYFGIVTY